MIDFTPRFSRPQNRHYKVVKSEPYRKSLLTTLAHTQTTPRTIVDSMTAYMDHKDLANTIITPERAQQISDGVHRTLEAVSQAAVKAGREPSRGNAACGHENARRGRNPVGYRRGYPLYRRESSTRNPRESGTASNRA